MASALFRRRLETAGGLSVQVETAGLLDAGRPVSDGAVRVLSARGLDISAHRSRSLDPDLIRSATVLIGMERRHVQEAVLQYPDVWPRAFTLKEFVRRAEAVGPRTFEPLAAWMERLHLGRAPRDLLTASGDDITDPYGRPVEAFRLVADELDDLLGRFVDLAWGHADDRPGATAPAERAPVDE